MNTELFLYASLMLFSTFISSLAQVLLKQESSEQHDSVMREYLNPRVVIAYAVFVASTLLCIIAYRVVPLSMGPILEATGYIYVTIFGVLVFKERIDLFKLTALALIVSGIVVYSVFG